MQKSLSARTFSKIANSIWQTNLVFTLFWVRGALSLSSSALLLRDSRRVNFGRERDAALGESFAALVIYGSQNSIIIFHARLLLF